MEYKNYIITIEDTTTKEKMTVETSLESSITEWIRIFKIILKWITFEDKTIKENFPEEK